MKIRLNFVSNSSSTSFIITNLSKKKKTLVDFVRENPELLEDFKECYDYNNVEGYTYSELIKSAKDNNIFFEPHDKKECIFGDESGTLIGHVFDYALRGGGKSTSFKWKFFESLR